MQRKVLSAVPWIALTIGGLLLVATILPYVIASPVEPLTASAREPAGLVGLAPRAGDQGLYEVMVGEGEHASTHRFLMEWVLADVTLPGGEVRAAPTVGTVLLAEDTDVGLAQSDEPRVFLRTALNPGKDYSAGEPPLVEERRVHLDAVPGVPRAETTVWRLDEEARSGTRTQWSERVLRLDDCDLRTPEAILGAVAGRTARAAEDALARCGVTFEDLGGGTWRVEAAEGRVRVVMTPTHSLPTRIEFAAATFDGTAAAVATLVAWRSGTEGLDAVEFPLEPRALPLVEWSAEGPSEGDLVAHPFRAAHRALVQQSDVAREYFASHANERVYFATHAWNGAEAPATTPLNPVTPWAHSVKGVRCGATGSPVLEGTGGDWTTSWIHEQGSLFTIVEQTTSPALPGSAAPEAFQPALERVVYAKTDSFATRHGGAPSTLAPTPLALLERLSDVDAYQNDGVYSIDYAFVPTDHGNVDGAAAVSRGTCVRDTVTNHVWYRGTSAWFVDGRATALVFTDVQRETRAPIGFASASPPPAGDARPPLAANGWTLAGTALAGGGAALLAPRILHSGYTRITRATVLANPTRRRLFEIAREHPGVSFQALAAKAGIHRNTVEHHVRTLAQHHHVRLGRSAEGILVYPTDDPRAGFARVIDLTNAEPLLACVLATPGQSQREIAHAIGMRQSHASELLQALEREGLVERRKDGRHVRVYATARAVPLVRARG